MMAARAHSIRSSFPGTRLRDHGERSRSGPDAASANSERWYFYGMERTNRIMEYSNPPQHIHGGRIEGAYALIVDRHQLGMPELAPTKGQLLALSGSRSNVRIERESGRSFASRYFLF